MSSNQTSSSAAFIEATRKKNFSSFPTQIINSHTNVLKTFSTIAKFVYGGDGEKKTVQSSESRSKSTKTFDSRTTLKLFSPKARLHFSLPRTYTARAARLFSHLCALFVCPSFIKEKKKKCFSQTFSFTDSDEVEKKGFQPTK